VVTRNGTDYEETETPLAVKMARVKTQHIVMETVMRVIARDNFYLAL